MEPRHIRPGLQPVTPTSRFHFYSCTTLSPIIHVFADGRVALWPWGHIAAVAHCFAPVVHVGLQKHTTNNQPMAFTIFLKTGVSLVQQNKSGSKTNTNSTLDETETKERVEETDGQLDLFSELCMVKLSSWKKRIRTKSRGPNFCHHPEVSFRQNRTKESGPSANVNLFDAWRGIHYLVPVVRTWVGDPVGHWNGVELRQAKGKKCSMRPSGHGSNHQ